jgi:hypothetical protein
MIISVLGVMGPLLSSFIHEHGFFVVTRLSYMTCGYVAAVPIQAMVRIVIYESYIYQYSR